jgi:hypothetical protein
MELRDDSTAGIAEHGWYQAMEETRKCRCEQSAADLERTALVLEVSLTDAARMLEKQALLQVQANLQRTNAAISLS